MVSAGKPSSPAAATLLGAYSYFNGDAEAKARGLFRVLDEDGKADANDVAHFDRDRLREFFAGMLRIRVIDARMIALQRQGRVSFYGEALGQEAAIVGSAAASKPQDWIVPALREAGVGLFRGLTLDAYVAQIYGNAEDVTKGRQMPCHPCDRAHNYVVMSSCIATQLPHAVGIAMGMKLSGDVGPAKGDKGGDKGKVAIGYIGDGGTSEGDFHAAMNFAAVYKVPAVIICQNNQWAISTPGAEQTAADTIALKGLGYGIESLRADGNDVLAVHDVCKYAYDKARRGDGPTFIELLTYRVSAHSSSDDPTRYRDEGVTNIWRTKRDPLRRLQLFLEARGMLAVGEADALAAATEQEVRDAIARQEAAPAAPAVTTLIQDVYETPTWPLLEQLAALETPTS